MDRSRVTIDGIPDARARAPEVVKLTPMGLSAMFTHLCGKEIHLKMENLQKTGPSRCAEPSTRFSNSARRLERGA